MPKNLYEDHFVGKEILKFKPGPTQTMSEADFKKLMEENRRKNIKDLMDNKTPGYRFDKYYKDKHDLEFSFSERFWQAHSLDKYWKEYNIVKQLIMTDKYDFARASILKDNLNNMFNQLRSFKGGDKKTTDSRVRTIIANINALKLDDLLNLLKAKDNKNNNNVNKLFPTFTEFYNVDNATISDLEERVTDAFEAAGLEYDKSLEGKIQGQKERRKELKNVRNNEVQRLLEEYKDDVTPAVEEYFAHKQVSYTNSGRPYFKFVKRSLSNAYIKFKGYGKE